VWANRKKASGEYPVRAILRPVSESDHTKTPVMEIILWVLVIAFVGLCAVSVFHFKRQGQTIQKLKASLLAINRQTHDQETRFTENKARWEQTEEKLRSFLQLMDTLLNTIPNPIYFKDADGVFQGCNKVFAKQILGLTRDRIIGKRPQELSDHIPADLAATYQREEIKMTEKMDFHTFEAQVRCADGVRRDFLFNLAPVLDRDDQFDGSVAVLSDLTDKNRAARNQMQKEKLEGVLETAGAVCHEFNQPLQALSGYTELMAMKLADHAVQPDIEKLTTQIERMRDITDKLQGVTRYETKAYAGETKIIDINKASQ
jgi:PAS domain S-box-containing protein